MKNRKVINIQVGKAIKDLREAAGLTQEQFAELISMSTKNVSSVERGRVGVSLSTLKHICEKLNVSSDRILFGDRYTNNVDLLSERFSLLSPEEFATVSDVFNKLFIATAIHRK